MKELKNIRIKSSEVYSKLDDWIVDYTKNENMSVNEVISKIRETIDGDKPLDTDMRISSSDIQADDEDVKFIEAVLDKSFIQSEGQTKFSLDWAYNYTAIFPEMIPLKWKEYPLIYIKNMITKLEVDESGNINWWVFITWALLSEAYKVVIDRKSVVRPYRQSLTRAVTEFSEYIPIDIFLKVKGWFDEHLSIKKSEVVIEEDKEEIDHEIWNIKFYY